MNGKKGQANEIAVDNLNMAAYLHLQQFPISRIVRSGRFGVFYFPLDKAGAELTRYMGGSTQVDGRSYVAAIREIKRLTDQLLASVVDELIPKQGTHR